MLRYFWLKQYWSAILTAEGHFIDGTKYVSPRQDAHQAGKNKCFRDAVKSD